MKIPKFQNLIMVICFVLINSISHSQDIPSCYDIVKTKDKPGVISQCAPIMLTDSIAYDFLHGEFGEIVKKIGYDWYIIIPTGESFDPLLWELLMTLVSSVQTLYSENADCYIVEAPKTKREAQLLLLGGYPKNKIKAYAKYIMPEDLFSFERKRATYPPECFHRIYKMFVY